MKVVVVGQGVAGKTILSLFAKSVVAGAKIQSIIVVNDVSSNNRTALQLHTGIWSPAVRIMQSHLDKSYKDFIRNSCPVSKSAYLSMNGDELVAPRNGLQSSPSQPSLRFIRNHDLLQALEPEISYPVIHDEIVGAKSINNKLHLLTGRGDKIEADVLIAADGSFSKIRELIHKKHSHYLEHRGYTVFRGHTPYNTLNPKQLDSLTYSKVYYTPQDILSFQAWGPESRFAVVPTNTGLAWFAALSSSKLSIDNIRKITAIGGPPGGAGGALWNNSEQVSEVELIALRKRFKAWHQPISALLQAPSSTPLVKTEAIGFKRVVQGGLSTVAKDTNTAVFFLGDAAHTLDPILAQGAGIAIEDAYHAFQSINKHILSTSSSSSSSKDNANIATTQLQQAVTAYETQRHDRIQRLHRISNLAQRIGHIDSVKWNEKRDSWLRGIPSFVKGIAFDRFIQYVS